MFRGAFADFEDDPFFRFIGSSLRNQQVATRDMFGGGMFGDMFASMNTMMANMQRNFEQMASNPNTYSYSSSSVMSYSNDGRGEPKVFQATKSTKRAPGGVKETQHTLRDSESGLHRMAIGHHLGDRSHVIERSLNRRTGDEDRKQNFINLDESDAAAFDQEWKQRTKLPSHSLRDGQRTTLRGLEEPRARPSHHSRHAEAAAPFMRDTGALRERDRLRVNGEGAGTHREMENRYRDHRGGRDKDWGSGDFDEEKSHRDRREHAKHVRLNSRPVNRHEPRGGL
ncbi:hypothetical protein pdam_00014589 [Pocillopora damicornis]|uniref:Myeloid leukemia factor 1 n=1 Tax=Pocillopora damicornis TaxID=46731 RepID=A0A3M6UHA4_POCDA|nr:hypothetical protein pdam_00014589 [Pocillopora damicornis]